MGRTVAAKRHRLAARRKAVGLSQAALADRIGVDRSTVVRWEQGVMYPHPWYRPRLARALAVSLDELDTLLAPAGPDRTDVQAPATEARVVRAGSRIEVVDPASGARLLALAPQAAAELAEGLASALGRVAQSSASQS